MRSSRRTSEKSDGKDESGSSSTTGSTSSSGTGTATATRTADAASSTSSKPQEPAGKEAAKGSTASSGGRVGGLLRASHPRQALAFAVAVGALAALMGRPLREVLVSALAVLLAQLALGLADDVCDVAVDRRSGAEGKPLASGAAAPGDATFVALALLIVLVPVSLQVGTTAGLFLLGSVVVGWVHDRWLTATPLSFVGWAATFALLTCFLSFGGWAREANGTAPVTQFLVLAAVLGVLVHFLTTLPDLVEDNRAGVRSLPLRIALRTGAPRLLLVTGVLTVAVVAALVWTALTVGVAR